jgi:hypothetical protein
VLSDNGRWLFAVSAASNQITAFAVDEGELRLASIVSSGGTTPISVTSHGKLVYVLNAGGAGNITGFEVNNRGALVPIPVGRRALARPDPALPKSSSPTTASTWWSAKKPPTSFWCSTWTTASRGSLA